MEERTHGEIISGFLKSLIIHRNLPEKKPVRN
jgi:hypothetical protein